MRIETNYYCEICGRCHYEAEDALACEESHKCIDSKPKYNKGDLLHYVDPEDAMDIYVTYEDDLEVYWDAGCKSWIYKHWSNRIPEDAIDLEMTAEEYTKRVASIKAKLELAGCYDISVKVDCTAPRFSISAYWSKTDRWKQ